MPLEIPLTFDNKKINDFFKKFYSSRKVLGYLFWIGLIIYFFYRYIKFNNKYSFIFSMVLFGMLLREIYNKWRKIKINKKKL